MLGCSRMPLARSATCLSLSHAAAQPAATAGSDAAAPMASQAPRPISFRRIKPIEAAGSPSTPPRSSAVRRRRRCDRRAQRFTTGLRRRVLVFRRCLAVGRAHSFGLAALDGLSRRFLQSLLLVINTYRLSRAAGPFLRPFYDIPRPRLTTMLPFWDGFRDRRLQNATKPEKGFILTCEG